MPQIDLKVQNTKIQSESITGFLGGLNTFQDQTTIKDNELTQAKNIVLTIDGIMPRYGTTREWTNDSDTRIYSLEGFYKTDGTRQLLRISGGKLKKQLGTGWSTIGSTSFANILTTMLQARDKVFFFNGSDSLRVYDGNTVTTYTGVSIPTNLAVTATGTTGSTAYSYRVSAVNAQGETLACTAVNITNGNAILSASNYNALAWDAMPGATGYNVYGRKATGMGQTYMSTVYTNSFKDVGDYDASGNATGIAPSITTLAPEGDTTAGIKCKYACFAISRIFAAGDPDNPCRLYWGGVAANIANFSGAPEGGGYVDVFKNDGAVIKAIIPFQGGVIVGKENGIFKFSFNTASGFPQLEEITRSFGMIAHHATLAVENDIIFPAAKDGRLAFYSLGNQENYAATVLRTNELSIKVATNLENADLGYLENATAFYYRNIYGCAVPKSNETTNSRIWCLDTRFGAWVYWEDLSPSDFAVYTETDGSQNLYYGDNSDGYVYKMFQNERNDNGVAINVAFSTKSFNQKLFGTYKKFIKPTFQFKDVSTTGNLSGDIITDGVIVAKEFNINNLITSGLGIGASLVGGLLVGDATGGTPAEGEPSDQLVEIWARIKARSIKYSFTSSYVNLQYKFLSLKHTYEVLQNKRLPDSTRVY